MSGWRGNYVGTVASLIDVVVTVKTDRVRVLVQEVSCVMENEPEK